MDENNLIVLKEYDSVNNAEWERSLLEGAGIWAMVRNEIMSAIYPTGVIPAQLIINNENDRRSAHSFQIFHADSACV